MTPTLPLLLICLDGQRTVPPGATAWYRRPDGGYYLYGPWPEAVDVGPAIGQAITAWLEGTLLLTPNASGVLELDRAWHDQQASREALAQVGREDSFSEGLSHVTAQGRAIPLVDAVGPVELPPSTPSRVPLISLDKLRQRQGRG